MAKRAFMPPAVCGACDLRPAVGHTLWYSGTHWLCPACLAEDTPGLDVTTKMTDKNLQAEGALVLSRRAKAAGEIETAAIYEQESRWHSHAVASLADYGDDNARATTIAGGEAVTLEQSQWVRDTLADPGLAALDASRTRGNCLYANDILALGIDVSNTIGAENTAEKLIAHEIALAHKVAFEQANLASKIGDPAVQLKRLNVSARMMTVAQQGIATLQKLRTGGKQTVVVQHVHVNQGGQAVIGPIQGGDGKK